MVVYQEPANLGSHSAAASVRRNQWWMVLICVVLLGLMGSLYAFMRHEAETRQSAHRVSFYEYVVTHHLGELEDLADGTAIDASTYVLTLNQPVADQDIERTIIQLMQLYVQYDHGEALILRCTDPASSRPVEVAEAHYNPAKHQLSLNLRPRQGPQTHVVLDEPW
jgi:hypothetical protein